MIRAFVLALQLLTRLPVPSLGSPLQPRELGLAVLFFPLIGGLIGVLLAGLNTVLWLSDPGVAAALVLTVWVVLTGGLHLDGLADAADAWIGGQGNRDRTLTIMKDPRSGPIAIVAISLLLLNKFTALQALLGGDGRIALMLTPVLGRTLMVLLLLSLPYVRPEGLGAPYAHYLPRISCSLMVAVVGVATLALLGWQGGLLLGVLAVGFLGFRQALWRRLGGVTGDFLGAACEVTEAVVLLALVLLADLEVF